MTRSFPVFPTAFVEIGYLGQPHGLRGEINLNTIRDFEADKDQFVYVDIDSTWIPLKIASVRLRSEDQYLIRFDGYSSEDAVTPLKGHYIALGFDKNYLAHFEDDQFYIDDLQDFEVRDISGADYGVIIGIDQSTDNNLLIIKRLDDTVTYIPFVDEFISSIDPDDNFITIDLPVGYDEIF